MKDSRSTSGRARVSNVWMVLSVAATVLGLGMLALILGSLFLEGLPSLSPQVFTADYAAARQRRRPAQRHRRLAA